MRLGGDDYDRRGGGDAAGCDPRVLGICVLGTSLAVLIVTLMSFAVVHPTEYGVKYDHLFQTIDPDPEGPGRHPIGFWRSFVLYPSVVGTIEFSSRGEVNGKKVSPPLKTRTSEGLDLTVHVAFQYKLVKEALPNMYKSYKDDYRSVFTRRAVSVLLAGAGQFAAEEYWLKRKEIADTMKENLKIVFSAEATIQGLQILLIDLPTIFENKIVETQVQEQIEKTRNAEQNATITRAEIDVEVAEKDRQQVIIQNTAKAQARLIERTAVAEAQKARLDIEKLIMNGVYSKMGLSATGLVAYQRGIAYQNLDSAQFIFGAEQAAAIMNINSGITRRASAQKVASSAAPTCKLKRRLSASPAQEERRTWQAAVKNPEEDLPATPPFNITIHL